MTKIGLLLAFLGLSFAVHAQVTPVLPPGTIMGVPDGSPAPASALTALPGGVDSSAATVLATNALAARTEAAIAADRYNVKSFGAKEDALTVANCSWTSGVATISCTGGTGAAWSSADIGKGITIPGALSGNLALTTTISGVNSSTSVNLAATPTNSSGIGYVTGISAVGGTPTGTYAPGDTVTFAGGTFTTAASIAVRSTQVSTVTVNNGGSGGTFSPCYITGTTGSGVLFVQKVSLTSGVITGIVGSPLNNGYYTTNPTSLTAEPVTGAAGSTGCNVTGATMTLQMSPATVALANAGAYSVLPSTPASQNGNSTSGGSGATYTFQSSTPNQATYGTNDTTAWNTAVAQINTDYATYGLAATRRCIYMPAGVSYTSGAITPFGQYVPGCILGDIGDYKSTIYIAPQNGTSTAYDLFSWDDAWEGAGGNFATNSTTQSLKLSQGPTVIGINFLADRTSSADITVMHFYGQDDNIALDRLNAFNIKGQMFKTGDLGAGDTKAFTREGTYGFVRCFSCGDTGQAIWEFFASGSATGGSDEDIIDFNAYGNYGDCLWIHSDATNIRAYNVHHIRCEGNQNNTVGTVADWIHISGPSDTGYSQRVHVLNAQLDSIYYGGCGVHVDKSSSNLTVGSAPYDIQVNVGFGGVNLGAGFCVDSGSNMRMNGANTTDINVQPVLTVGTPTFPYIQVDGAGSETQWTNSINSLSTANVITMQKQQFTAALGSAGYLSTPLGSVQYGNGAGYSTAAPNTSTTQEVLCETGTGSAGAAPAFCVPNGTPLLLAQSALPMVVPPSGYITATGTVIIGQAPPFGVTFSATSGTGVTVTFSGATLTGTAAGDTNRVITINDSGAYKYFTITGNSGASTTVAQGTISGGTLGTTTYATTLLWLSGTNSTTNTAASGTTYSVPLDYAYPRAYFYIPSGPITSAGLYYCVPASTTVATCYNNTYTSGTPTTPGSPTAFSGLTAGTYPQSTAAINLITAAVAAGSLQLNGCLDADFSWTNNNSANTKGFFTMYNTTGTTLSSTTTTSSRMQEKICNAGNAAVQSGVAWVTGAASSTVTTPNPIRGTVNSAAAFNTYIGVTLATATDTATLESYQIKETPN